MKARDMERASDTPHQTPKLERNFSLLSVCSVGVVTGNTWAALGGSIAVSVNNGGPPGLIYEFIAVSLFYWLVAASLAELASSVPSSAGVYHWASITGGPRYGRVCGWFAGWWNYFAWNFGSASIACISAQISVQMYATYHPNYVYESWHVFVTFITITWTCCGLVLFANRALPSFNRLGLFLIVAGVLVTVLVCTIMPSTTGSGYAASSFVWQKWTNDSGYQQDGLVFLAGMLNGAYAVGTPDCVSHLAEEIPSPRRNVPRAIAAQMLIGFITGLVYLISLSYAVHDLDDVRSAPIFPLTRIYAQATSSTAATLGLLLLILLPSICSCVGTYITAGRTLWTLARDNATPCASWLGQISPTHKNPLNATVACGIVSTVLGLIYLGSSTAFDAFVGSFVILSKFSYLLAIVPFVVNGRFSGSGGRMVPGPFVMRGWVGYTVNVVSCVYIVIFGAIYCLPYEKPVTAQNMNFSSVIIAGLSVFVACLWRWKGKMYARAEERDGIPIL